MRHKRDKLPVHTGQPLEMAKLPLGQFTGKGGQTPEKNIFYITQVKELIKYTCADKSLVINTEQSIHEPLSGFPAVYINIFCGQFYCDPNGQTSLKHPTRMRKNPK